MKKNTLIKISGLLMAMMLLVSCAPSGSGATEPPQATKAPGNAVTEEPTLSVENNELPPTPNACANPYYPVREGSTWNYKSTNTLTESYSFTDTITSVREDGFTLTSEFEGLTRTQEWACTPEGIVALQMGGGLSTSNTNLKVETQNAGGVTYPAEINTGDSWQHTLDFTGTMDIAGESGAAVGSTQSNFTALGMESVTVPAGTFDAMKVQVVTTFSASVSFQGLTVPVRFSSTTLSWYAAGTGWVKSESTGDLMGQAYTETLELQWYNIPP